MSPDIEDLLRSELRGAASGAPHDLGVDDQDVLTRGRRVIVRRRVLTVASVAAATLAIAGTIGVLAPTVHDDALPAIPTPTVTPTPDVSSTATLSPSPSATVTTSATATPSETPSASTPSSTPDRTPTKTPSPSTTPPSEVAWSKPISIDGADYRMRIAWQTVISDGQKLYYADLDSDRPGVIHKLTLDSQDPEGKGIVIADLDNMVLLTNWPVVDVITENKQSVTSEQFGRFALPHPDTGQTLDYVVIAMPRPVTQSAPLVPKSLQFQLADGSLITLENGTATG